MASIEWLGYRPGHIQYGDFLLGPDTVWRWNTLEGWEETPAVDSGTVARSTSHGSWPGVHLVQSRTITLNLVIRTEFGQMSAALRELARATPIDAPEEVPLAVQLDNEPPLICFARCSRRSISVDPTNRTGLARGAIQFEASDPRRYALTESQTSTPLPKPEGGISWPLAWPLAWGSAGSTGNASCNNTGDAPTNPVIEFHGPCTTPSVTNIQTGDKLEYDLTLAPGDVLYVNTEQGSVTLNGPQANRLYTATTQSDPETSFVLPPGANALAFRSSDPLPDPAARMVVTWRSAFW